MQKRQRRRSTTAAVKGGEERHGDRGNQKQHTRPGADAAGTTTRKKLPVLTSPPSQAHSSRLLSLEQWPLPEHRQNTEKPSDDGNQKQRHTFWRRKYRCECPMLQFRSATKHLAILNSRSTFTPFIVRLITSRVRAICQHAVESRCTAVSIFCVGSHSRVTT